MRRRGWLFVAAVALLLAWWSWPRNERTRAGAIQSRQARPAPAAPLHRAPSPSVDPELRPATSFGASRTGIAACDDYVARTLRCGQLPGDAKIAIAEASKAWAEAADRAALEDSCRATASVQGETLAAMGC